MLDFLKKIFKRKSYICEAKVFASFLYDDSIYSFDPRTLVFVVFEIKRSKTIVEIIKSERKKLIGRKFYLNGNGDKHPISSVLEIDIRKWHHINDINFPLKDFNNLKNDLKD